MKSKHIKFLVNKKKKKEWQKIGYPGAGCIARGRALV